MDALVYIYYPLLLLLLFYGARIEKAGVWNDDVLSLDHTKAFLGFQAILIIFHHLSQRTCAPWLEPSRIHHGLDAFVFIGYLSVAAFFFCSGYGMYVNAHSNERAFDHYFKRRILPLLAMGLLAWIMFYIAELCIGYKAPAPIWINVNAYNWYIPVMILVYLLFYLSFRVIKNETAGIAVLIALTLILFFFAKASGFGTWWYNTLHLFAVGVITARHREAILRAAKKHYVLLLVISVALFAALFSIGNYYYATCGVFHLPPSEPLRVTLEPFMQASSAVLFVFIMAMLGLKIRIGNKALRFLGTFTLEIYIAHPLFVRLFGFASFDDNVRPLYYIKNQFLYVLAVLVISLPLAFGIHRISSAIRNRDRAGSGKTHG